MGMYTRLVINVQLLRGTPDNVIESLQWLAGERDTPGDPTVLEWGFPGLFRCSSAYHLPSFTSHCDLRKQYDRWGLSTMFDTKNYWQQQESLIEWLTPYIERDGDEKTFIGYQIYEEDDEPTLLYIHHETGD